MECASAGHCLQAHRKVHVRHPAVSIVEGPAAAAVHRVCQQLQEAASCLCAHHPLHHARKCSTTNVATAAPQLSWLVTNCLLSHLPQALNKLSGAFTEADEQHIQLFGVHLGNTLAKSRFYEEAQ